MYGCIAGHDIGAVCGGNLNASVNNDETSKDDDDDTEIADCGAVKGDDDASLVRCAATARTSRPETSVDAGAAGFGGLTSEEMVL